VISVAEAQKRVVEAVEALPPAEVRISDAAGLVLAEDVGAPHPLPRFDNSAMDGFALRGADAHAASGDAPVRLTLVGEVKAGDPGELHVGPTEAARIMTGAPLPRGADAVVPVEETRAERDAVVVLAPTAPGRHVRPAGEDVREGELLVRAGEELGPGEIAVLASVGVSPVPVRRGPRVAVLVTGDELVDPEDLPRPGQIRDSNSVALRALVREAGGEVVPLERAADSRADVVEALRRAADLSDLVVSSGGVAVGRYDFVKEAVEELGHIDLWRVAMQPGKPLVLGAVGATPFLGLPGNPVSGHICFEQFVRPAIRKMRGCRSLLRAALRATLTDSIAKPPGRLQFVRVRLVHGDDGWTATPTGPQGSHIQTSLVGCHGVARFAAEDTRLSAGSTVDVEVWKLPASDEA
jgi:molybdopterin molybdotransferase